MRRIACLALTALTACSPQPAAPRDTLRYGPGLLVPLGRLHRETRLDSLAATWASEALTVMMEPRLDPAVIEGNVFRFLYRPAFRPAIAIRVAESASGCTLVRKEAVQRPPKEIGKEAGGITLLAWQQDSLVRADSISITKADCQALSAAVDSLELGTEPEFSMGVDGETLLFERIHDGRYLARKVWSPDSSRSPQYASAGRAFLRWAPPDSGR